MHISRFGGLLAITLVLPIGWLVVREPDFNRIRVHTVEDLETEWVGTADVERGVPAARDTLYHLSSLTKPYASAVLLRLIEEGRLELDAPDELVWHYGHRLESSSLIVEIPRRRVTFVILANSDGLSRWRRLGDDADVSASPAATLFLNWYSSRESGPTGQPERRRLHRPGTRRPRTGRRR